MEYTTPVYDAFDEDASSQDVVINRPTQKDLDRYISKLSASKKMQHQTSLASKPQFG